MLRRVGYLLSIAALSAVAITNPAAARRQPSGGQPQPSGSARVTGRVVAADTGTPVRLVKVSLDSQRTEGPNRPYVHVSRQIDTDVNGRFDFADLPAGSYNLAVSPKSGFVPLQRSKEATVAARRTLDVTVRLERSGAIEGRIQDENGDGMLAAEVHAVRRVAFGSYTTLAASGVSATTNDLGEFRLFNLPAGEYLRPGDLQPPATPRRPCPASRVCQHVLSWFAGASRRASSCRARRPGQRGRELHARALPVGTTLDHRRQFTRRPAWPGHATCPSPGATTSICAHPQVR